LLGNDSVNTFPEANALKNRTSIARQRINKHISLTIQDLFSVCSVPRVYKRAQSEDATEYRTVVESNRVESSELAAAEMARKELGGANKTSCVI
jgi:ABC-type enterochelin transport system ATPase subunit